MKYKFFCLLVFLLLTVTRVYAQSTNSEKFRLEIEAPQYKNSTVYVLSYWNGDTYAQDSCVLSPKGVGLIEMDRTLPAGQYMLYVKPEAQIEILLNGEQNDLKIKLAPSIENSKITGSKDTEILWQYIREANLLSEEQTKLMNKITDKTSESEKAALNAQMEEKQDAFASKINQLITDNKGTWASVFLKGMLPTELPNSEPKTYEDVKENAAFMREHYFDNIDLTDSRFLYTNYFVTYLDNYMTSWVEQTADSLASASSYIVGKAQGNKVMFEYLLSRFLNKSMTSNLMGMENTWARLAEDYIFDNPSVKMDSTEYINLRQKYEIIKNNRIGMQAHDLSLETLQGDSLNLYDIDTDYLILYFYNPTCAHCHREAKVINEEIYPKYKDRGLKIVTVNLFPEKSEWIRFIDELKIQDWYNCADPSYRSQYWMYYDTTAVPSLYLLDKNKKIIAKKIDDEGLKQIFGILYNEDGSN